MLIRSVMRTYLAMLSCLIGQDWPNLKRYRSENLILANSKPQDDRVVFMGNSITESWSTFQPKYFSKNNYINRGISGQTTPQMLIRFRQDVIDLDPKIVVILAGINDIAGNTGTATVDMIANNIMSMTELATSNSIHVVLCSVLPANKFSWSPNNNPSLKIIELNKVLKKYSNRNNVDYVDFYSALVNKRKGLKKIYGIDSVHPNSEGYQTMSEILEINLQKYK